jgi:hypothetical protein
MNVVVREHLCTFLRGDRGLLERWWSTVFEQREAIARMNAGYGQNQYFADTA